MPVNDLMTNRSNRWLLFAEWLGVMIIGTLGFTAARVWFYEQKVDFNPWEDLVGMYMLSPIGWGIIGLVSPLWIVLAGLITTVKLKKRVWHTLTILGTVFFGATWPSTFWAWMSV